MVKKANGKWWICIDYTNLNKTCPKDSFLLPLIDQLIDAMSDHQLLSFMDTFSDYNQIRMTPENEEKMSFITNKGLYCYKIIPFGLKNIRTTYQRVVNKVFKNQIDCNMKVYIDDMLVKSKEATLHIDDLTEAFDILRRYRMKLNPIKCAFDVRWKSFLVHGDEARHQGEPREDQGGSQHEAFNLSVGYSEANGMHGIFEPVPLQVCRVMPLLL